MSKFEMLWRRELGRLAGATTEESCYCIFFALLFGTFLLMVGLNHRLIADTYPEMLGGRAGMQDLAIESRLRFIQFLFIGLPFFAYFYLVNLQAIPLARRSRFIFRQWLIWCPALIWGATSVFSQQQNPVADWLGFSTLLSLINIFLSKRNMLDQEVESGLISLALAPFAALGLQFVVNLWRVSASISGPAPHLKNFSGATFILLPLILGLRLWIRRPKAFFDAVLWPLQVACTGLWLSLVPPPILVGNSLLLPADLKGLMKFVVLPLGIFSILELVVHRRRAKQPGLPWISLGTLISCLITLLYYKPVIPGVPSSVFEIGARLPVYADVALGYGTLFLDKQITYGLWDYFTFAIGQFGTGGELTVASSALGTSLMSALGTASMAACLSLTLSAYGTIMLTLAIGILFYAGCFVPVAVFSVLLNRQLVDSPARWLSVWGLLVMALPFMRIPQGSVTILATTPLFLMQLVTCVRTSRRELGAMLISIFILGGGLYWFTNYFDRLIGLVRSLAEVSPVNHLWAGSEWSLHFDELISGLGLAVLGNLQIATLLLALAVGLILHFEGFSRKRSFGLVSMVVVYAFMMISYGYSRGDGAPFSRQYQVLLTTLPFLFIFAFDNVRRPKNQALLLLGFVIVITRGAFVPRGVQESARINSRVEQFPEKAFVDGRTEGLPRLGFGVFDPTFVARQAALKKDLDFLLKPGETFFDLSIYGLSYFLSERPSPTEYPTILVYPSESTQKRAVRDLKKHSIDVIHLDETPTDGIINSVRVALLYHYALKDRKPYLSASGEIFLMSEARFKVLGLPLPSQVESIRMLKSKLHQDDLRYLPSAWGRRDQLIQRGLTEVDVAAQSTSEQAGGAAVEHVETFSPPLDGSKVDVIDILFDPRGPDCRETQAEVSWRGIDGMNSFKMTINSKKILIPLDAFPGWHLDPNIKNFRIRSLREDCPIMKISKLSFKRRLATENL